MASADWTDWEVIGASALTRYDVVRTGGNVYYFTSQNRIYQLDEDVQGGATLLETLPTPAGASVMIGLRMYYPGTGKKVWCLCYAIKGVWSLYPVVFRYNLETDTTTKVLDAEDGTGWTHVYDGVECAPWEWNEIGICIPCTERDGSEHVGNRGLLLCSYDGDNWFEGFHDTNNDPSSNSMASLYPEPYRMVQKRGAYYTKYATTNFITWGNWAATPLGNAKLGLGLVGPDPGNSDQWLYTQDGWLSNGEFKTDTSLTTLLKVGIGEGLYWTGANNGLSYWREGQWVLDYPSSPSAGQTIFDFFEGYTGHVFFSQYVSSVGKIWKRDRLGGGVWTGVGLGSVKLSIDRNSNHVYCTTYGMDTRATDYWRVSSDLSEVLLIDSSTVSGVYGAVHSQEEAGVTCYGNINGNLAKESQDSGLEFTLYGVPSGLEFSALEASTLYTKRDNSLPDDIIITVTLASGIENDFVYTYITASGWILLSSGNFVAESQVRRDEHSFLGALLSDGSGTRVVDYSSDGGYTWQQRDTGLPSITITDLDFA